LVVALRQLSEPFIPNGGTGDTDMLKALGIAAAFALSTPLIAHAQAAKINDAQIAHIAYTAGVIDVTAGKQALAKSHDKAVRGFAEEMVRDHTAVNDQALALVKKLGVTPQDNPTSQALNKDAAAKLKTYGSLNGAAFDKAYLLNEIAYHKTVNGALSETLIPNAQNPELKSLLQTGLKLFTDHQTHAEHLAAGHHY
jgi:putative membrane protein